MTGFFQSFLLTRVTQIKKDFADEYYMDLGITLIGSFMK